MPGFAKAVAGPFVSFVNWHNDVAWCYKARLQAANVGANLNGIWQMFQ
ncbi:hypothetical protein GCM10010425_83660 [Streptomyces spororaveus]|nr:hypothetical protein [Streptomyces sp. NBC_00160]MCX5308207.1 hypothetical protein [Streptomyces sp. NBC_00160]